MPQDTLDIEVVRLRAHDMLVMQRATIRKQDWIGEVPSSTDGVIRISEYAWGRLLPSFRAKFTILNEAS